MVADALCNVVYYSTLLPEKYTKVYRGIKAILDKYGVPHAALTGTKDVWARDYMPIQVFPDRYCVYDYSPDYLRLDEKYHCMMGNPVEVCQENDVHYEDGLKDVRIDGGNVVRGSSKFIMTAKVFEENPAIPPRELIRMLEQSSCAELVLLPWDTHEMYGHSDWIVRIVDDDTVIMGNYRQIDPKMGERFLNILKAQFKTVHELFFDVPKLSEYSWAYINWLQTDKVIILPSVGVTEDLQALRQLEKWMQEYKGRIELADAKDLVKQGGAFNCATWTVYDGRFLGASPQCA